MSVRIIALFVVPALLYLGTAGCDSSTSTSPDHSAAAGGDAPETTGESESNPPTGVGDEMAPEGNSEPPLPDVTSAVDELPSADAANVTLTTVTPQEFDAVIAKHKGKVVFVDFWATWCVPCRKAFPHTVEMAAKHPDNLSVVSMSFDDPDAREDALAFLKEQNATFDNLSCALGGGDESFTAYDIGDAGLPYFRLYNREGELVQVFKNDIDAGKGVDEAEVHKAIEALLAP